MESSLDTGSEGVGAAEAQTAESATHAAQKEGELQPQPSGRGKRKAALTAQDAQLARALQSEWMRFSSRIKKEPSTSKGKHSPSAKSPAKQLAQQSNTVKRILKQEKSPQLLHFCSRNPEGFVDVDARRGCCICEDCAELLAEELRSGSGLAVLRGALSIEAVEDAKAKISRVQKDGSEIVRFGELGPAHRRVWSLLHLGKPFTDIVTLPAIFKIFGRVLGEDFALGSCSANDIGPGCPNGPAHVDYPYSMLKRFPEDTIACQAIFCLDNFTKRNGGTQAELHSQKSRSHPDRDDPLSTVVEAQPGDVIIYNSLLHHRSGRNRTDENRIGMLCQFLSKYVRPMEEQVETLPDEIKRNASKRLKQLLALDCPFPIKEPAITGGYHDMSQNDSLTKDFH
mmetsp:Transcript_24495/g.38535  ORF Transcript_24495/g.38535 Transcript_24495/m.38535 type:complete len:397 (+) Transcript_24495:181-1371(+)